MRAYIYIYMYMCVKLKAQARLLLIAMRASMFAKLVARIQAQLCFVPVSMFTPVCLCSVFYICLRLRLRIAVRTLLETITFTETNWARKTKLESRERVIRE